MIDLIPYRVGDSYYIYSRCYQSIVSQSFDSVTFLDPHLEKSSSLIVKEDESYSLISSLKDIDNPRFFPVWEKMKSRDVFILVGDYYFVGILDSFGKEVVPLEFKEIKYGYNKSCDFFIVRKLNKFGVIDCKNFKIVLPVIFDSIKFSSVDGIGDQIFTLFKGTRVFFYNWDQQKSIKLPHHDDIVWSNESVCCIKNDKSWFLYNFELKEYLYSKSCDFALPYEGGFSICRKEQEWYAIYIDGRKLNLPFLNKEGLHVKRYSNIVITTERIFLPERGLATDKNYIFSCYNNFVFQFSFQIISHKFLYCRLEDQCLLIYEDGKYSSHILKRLSLQGLDLGNNDIHSASDEYGKFNSQNHKLSYELTGNSLYFNKILLYQRIDGRIGLETLQDIVRLYVVLDDDFEHYIESTIGYLDLVGNKFWEDDFPVCDICGMSDRVYSEWDGYRCIDCDNFIE